MNHGETGILITPKNTDELFLAIQFLILNQNERVFLTNSAYDYAQNNFSLDAVFDNFIEVYESLGFFKIIIF